MFFNQLSKYINIRTIFTIIIPACWMLWLLNAPTTTNLIKENKTKIIEEISNEPEEKKEEEIAIEPENSQMLEDLELDFSDSSEREKKIATQVKTSEQIKPQVVIPRKSTKMYTDLNAVLSVSKSDKISHSSNNKIQLIPNSVVSKSATVETEEKNNQENKSANSIATKNNEAKVTEEKKEDIKEKPQVQLSFKPEMNASRVTSVTNKTLEALKEIKENNKAAIQNSTQPKQEYVNADILLREKVNGKEQTLKVDSDLNNKLKTTWVPKYLQKKIVLEDKIGTTKTTAQTNNQPATNEIVLIDLIENSIAVVKNTSNNMIEYLRSGDTYNGLKLMKINANDIIFSDEKQGKTYTKVLNIN